MASSLLLATIVVLGLAGAASASGFGPICNCGVGGYCPNNDGICQCYDGFYGENCDINCFFDQDNPYCACRDCDFGNQNIQITAHGYIAHDYYCNKFWQCTRTHSNGQNSYEAVLQCCANGTKWDQSQLTCVHGSCNPYDYSCPLPPPDPTSNPWYCYFIANQKNLLVHPYQCHGYLQCDNLNVVEKCCPDGLIFNDAGQYCDHDYNIQHPNPNCWAEDCNPPPPTPCPGAIFCCWFSYSLQDQSTNQAYVGQQGNSSVTVSTNGAYCDGNDDFLIVQFFSNQWISNDGPTRMLILFAFTPFSGGYSTQGLFGNGGCGHDSTIGCKIYTWGQYRYLECWVNGVTVHSSNTVNSGTTYYAYLYYNNGYLTLILNYAVSVASGSPGRVQGNQSPFYICHNGCSPSTNPFKGYIYKIYWYVDDDCDGHMPSD